MKFGVCYYPEHWPQERWPQDAQLMRQAGISLVRIAEFAWALMEPQEGQFSWDWLDRSIEVLAAEDLKVILGTPTASPPPWLTRAYPEVLPVDIEGRRRRHGSRRHYCANNAIYRQHTERIVSAMASRYGDHPAIVGWQIDNEFGCHYSARCYCETCAVKFHRWLEAKYQTTDDLNNAWGNVFWSQIYEEWSEIDPPNLTVAGPNPSHLLDYYRFSSDSFLSYQELQFSLLKSSISEGQFITTNFMSQFTDLNYHDLARPIDMVTMSSYPTGRAELRDAIYMPQNNHPAFPYDVGDPYVTGFGHTLMRGFKSDRPFWVMEQQCGNINWGIYNTGIRSGTVRLWTWHALASGAEAVLFFRWRASLFAQEQFHSGLLRHDGSPGVGYGDLEMMKSERQLLSEIATAPHEAQIGFLLDYDSMWTIQIQPHRREFGYLRYIFLLHRALQRLGIPADIVSDDADLSKYKMIIVPAGTLGSEQLTTSLQSFVEAGGTVLFGVRSGFKTPNNQFIDQRLPGPFLDLVGVTVGEWHALPPNVGYELDSTIPDLDGPATIWAELLNPIHADPQTQKTEFLALVRYTSGPFSSAAALSEVHVGAGRALYLGWYPNDQQAKALMAHIAPLAGVHPIADLPEGLIASKRGEHVILLNVTDEALIATIQGRDVIVNPRDVEVVSSREG